MIDSTFNVTKFLNEQLIGKELEVYTNSSDLVVTWDNVKHLHHEFYKKYWPGRMTKLGFEATDLLEYTKRAHTLFSLTLVEDIHQKTDVKVTVVIESVEFCGEGVFESEDVYYKLWFSYNGAKFSVNVEP